MTSYSNEKETAVAGNAIAPPEPKPEEKTIPSSRIKSDPKLWAEASELADMLTYCRPHLSKTERQFIAKYLVPLEVFFDKKGNIYKQIGANPTVLWSSHTDTVHAKKGFQKIEYYPHKTTGDIFFQVAAERKSSCLGADDTCGIWLMIQMIKANVPGLYIFHRGEEVGGIGSKWITENNKSAVDGIKYAIAFDRKDEKSIITYQRGQRCCSDEFADSLATQLGMGHRCDTTGSFTDTASYVDLVAECTNISVGYDLAHSRNEQTNVDYLFRLRDALLKLDLTKLVEKRKPGEVSRLYYGNSWDNHGYGGHWNGNNWNRSQPEYKVEGLFSWELRKKYINNLDQALKDYAFDMDTGLWYKIGARKDLVVTQAHNGNKARRSNISHQELIRMIRLNPEIIADLLDSLSYGPDEVKDYLIDYGCTGNTDLLI